MGELVKRLSEETSTLIRQEMRLAQLELKDKGRNAGVGIGLFGGGGVFAVYGVGTLIAATILALGTAVELWLAAVIVVGVLLATAGLLALTGKKKVEEAAPLVPEAAIESVQTDVQEIKSRAGRA